MAGYCTSVRLYFHEPQASENTAQECNIQKLDGEKAWEQASVCDSCPTNLNVYFY